MLSSQKLMCLGWALREGLNLASLCEALIDVLRPSIERLLKIYGVSARITFGCRFGLGFGAGCCTIGLQAELVCMLVFLTNAIHAHLCAAYIKQNQACK